MLFFYSFDHCHKMLSKFLMNLDFNESTQRHNNTVEFVKNAAAREKQRIYYLYKIKIINIKKKISLINHNKKKVK